MFRFTVVPTSFPRMSFTQWATLDGIYEHLLPFVAQGSRGSSGPLLESGLDPHPTLFVTSAKFGPIMLLASDPLYSSPGLRLSSAVHGRQTFGLVDTNFQSEGKWLSVVTRHI